jgi:addiction module HigA family antidote
MSKKPLHPAVIAADFMEEYGLSQADLARGLGVPRSAVSELLQQKRGLSVEMAVRLGTFFGDGASIWWNLQREFDFDSAESSGVVKKLQLQVKPLLQSPHLLPL